MIPWENKWYTLVVNERESNKGIVNKGINRVKGISRGVDAPGPRCTASLDDPEVGWGLGSK